VISEIDSLLDSLHLVGPENLDLLLLVVEELLLLVLVKLVLVGQLIRMGRQRESMSCLNI
jgi:hypothetical protein